MFGDIRKKEKASHSVYVTFNLISAFLLLTRFVPFHHAEVHMLVKRSSGRTITPEECEKQVLKSEASDAECFKINQDAKCDEHCNKLGEETCGGTNGKAYNYQCKNKQKGSKKACCCAFQCESQEETERRLEKQFAKMKKDTGGLCTPITYSQEDLQKELKDVCANDDRIHIARKFCLEEKKGEEYFCLKIGECKGKQTQTCLGCVSHECVMKGESDGDIITIPEDYEKERREKQDFDKSVAGNVEDRKNTVVKDKACAKIKCKNDDCDKKCRKLCKKHGFKECGGKALKYGSTVEGKRSGGKKGENKCCCEPVCYPEKDSKIRTEEEEEVFNSEAHSASNENVSILESSDEPVDDAEDTAEESKLSEDMGHRDKKISDELRKDESIRSEDLEDKSEKSSREAKNEESDSTDKKSTNESKFLEDDNNISEDAQDEDNQDYTLKSFYDNYGLHEDNADRGGYKDDKENPSNEVVATQSS